MEGTAIGARPGHPGQGGLRAGDDRLRAGALRSRDRSPSTKAYELDPGAGAPVQHRPGPLEEGQSRAGGRFLQALPGGRSERPEPRPHQDPHPRAGGGDEAEPAADARHRASALTVEAAAPAATAPQPRASSSGAANYPGGAAPPPAAPPLAAPPAPDPPAAGPLRSSTPPPERARRTPPSRRRRPVPQPALAAARGSSPYWQPPDNAALPHATAPPPRVSRRPTRPRSCRRVAATGLVSERDQRPPLYRRPWFWAGVGGATLLAVATIFLCVPINAAGIAPIACPLGWSREARPPAGRLLAGRLGLPGAGLRPAREDRHGGGGGCHAGGSRANRRRPGDGLERRPAGGRGDLRRARGPGAEHARAAGTAACRSREAGGRAHRGARAGAGRALGQRRDDGELPARRDGPRPAGAGRPVPVRLRA